jgi:ribosomal protein S18 acetylase RimI-like enzyme
VTGELRPATAADRGRLVQIFVAAFQHGYPDVLPADVLAGVDEATVTAWFERWTTADGLETVVADIGGTVVGFIRFGTDPDDPDTQFGYVAALYVDPDAAGRGVGRRLLDHALDAFASQGRPAVRLWVFAANDRARGLYASSGFAADGGMITDPQWRVPQIRLRRDLSEDVADR